MSFDVHVFFVHEHMHFYFYLEVKLLNHGIFVSVL